MTEQMTRQDWIDRLTVRWPGWRHDTRDLLQMYCDGLGVDDSGTCRELRQRIRDVLETAAGRALHLYNKKGVRVG